MQRARLPQRASCIKEVLHLTRHHAEPVKRWSFITPLRNSAQLRPDRCHAPAVVQIYVGTALPGPRAATICKSLSQADSQHVQSPAPSVQALSDPEKAHQVGKPKTKAEASGSLVTSMTGISSGWGGAAPHAASSCSGLMVSGTCIR